MRWSLSVVLLVASTPVSSQTIVSGTISADTTWGLSGSPYVLSSTVTVNTGVTLTLSPGVVVKGEVSNSMLNVAGTLLADGKSDILWRHDITGQTWMYLMNGSVIAESDEVVTVPTLWDVVASGDYNGDGKSDILWRSNGSGQVWMYQMDGTSIDLSLSVTTVSSTWSIVGDGDYGGDGKSDILWRNLTGQNWLYLMDGVSIDSSVGINQVGGQWKVVNTN